MNLKQVFVVMSWLPVLLATVAMAISVYSPSDLTSQDLENGESDAYIIKESTQNKGNGATQWLDQLLNSFRQYRPSLSSMHKRDPAMVETGLALRKRNNGIWIWMPAQGYVSVPKDEQVQENESSAKHGKIMRYGRRKRFTAAQ